MTTTHLSTVVLAELAQQTQSDYITLPLNNALAGGKIKVFIGQALQSFKPVR